MKNINGEEIDPELLVSGVQMYIYRYDPKEVNHTGSFFWDYKQWPHAKEKKIPIEEYNEIIKVWAPGRIDWLKGPEKSPFYCERCGEQHVVAYRPGHPLYCIICWNKYGDYFNVDDWTKVDKKRREFASKFIKKCQNL